MKTLHWATGERLGLVVGERPDSTSVTASRRALCTCMFTLINFLPSTGPIRHIERLPSVDTDVSVGSTNLKCVNSVLALAIQHCFPDPNCESKLGVCRLRSPMPNSALSASLYWADTSACTLSIRSGKCVNRQSIWSWRRCVAISYLTIWRGHTVRSGGVFSHTAENNGMNEAVVMIQAQVPHMDWISKHWRWVEHNFEKLLDLRDEAVPRERDMRYTSTKIKWKISVLIWFVFSLISFCRLIWWR